MMSYGEVKKNSDSLVDTYLDMFDIVSNQSSLNMLDFEDQK
jgi:hypothetical protein